MIAIPAVDLRAGACVQLVRGSYEQERIRLADPVGIARVWAAFGFSHLHVVDLDAALGRGSNARLVDTILAQRAAAIHVGGGVRSRERIRELLDGGGSMVVVSTRALEEPDWLGDMADLFPGALIVAADVRERRIVTQGWLHTLPGGALDAVAALNDYPLGGVMVTAVHKEGLMDGPDLQLMTEVAGVSAFPLYAAGGIATIGDLRALQDGGVAGAVIGMALYTGTLDPTAVAEEFSA